MNTYKPNMFHVSIVIAGALVAGAIVYKDWDAVPRDRGINSTNTSVQDVGVELPVVWGSTGARLIESGVIDEAKWNALYNARGGMTSEEKRLLTGTTPGRLRMTRENAPYLLNLFWALGLAQKNPILETGEMADPRYGGAKNFASTGGWTLAGGAGAMDHYSMHAFFDLTDTGQAKVDRISRGIFRPCCGNSTHFPDCNHGMAMLGLLELMASEGASEEEMWKAALVVNTYWFPDTYATIATYLATKGIQWRDAKPETILGKEYSSASGFARIAGEVRASNGSTEASTSGGGGGCGVSAGAQTAPQPRQQRQSGGCGI